MLGAEEEPHAPRHSSAGRVGGRESTPGPAPPSHDANAATPDAWHARETTVATDATAALDRALDDPIDDAERDLSRSFYENYGPDAILSGAVPSYVTLHEPDWRIDPDELRAAFGPRTRPLIGPWD